MLTFTEYLEEAYTADMKKEIPSQSLQDIGNILAKHSHISVQDTEFTHLKKGWKKADIESNTYAIWKFTDGTVALSSLRSNNKHVFDYPEHIKGDNVVPSSLKKETKNVWVFNYEADVERKQIKRYISHNSSDKLDAVQNKIKKMSPTSVYTKLNKLVTDAGLKLEQAHIRGDGTPYVSIYTVPNSVLGNKGFKARIEYNKEWNIKIYCDSNCKHLDEYGDFVNDMNKLYSELKKIDLTQLPKFFV